MTEHYDTLFGDTNEGISSTKSQFPTVARITAHSYIYVKVQQNSTDEAEGWLWWHVNGLTWGGSVVESPVFGCPAAARSSPETHISPGAAEVPGRYLQRHGKKKKYELSLLSVILFFFFFFQALHISGQESTPDSIYISVLGEPP